MNQMEFHRTIRRLESLGNAGVTARYDAASDTTSWRIGDQEVGRSGGRIGESRWYEITC